MNSLLERQIRKYLPQELRETENIKDFLEAIGKSYDNNNDQLKMIQRAMKLSSDELFQANRKLSREAENQKKIIDTFKNCINTLNLKTPTNKHDKMEIDELAGYIEEQSEEIHRVQEQREELLQNLEKKNQVLSDYAHMVSHDLKSPLRSIDSLANWILQDNAETINSTSIENFKLLLKNVEKMDALIDGILNYSTIDQAIIDSYWVDLNVLTKDIIQILYKPDHINITIKNKLPNIKGDKFRLQQLFQNLIQNAVKSIDKPIGEIEIDVIEEEEFWKFSVKDNGKGIQPKHHLKIFRIFEKIENDQAATGIGLSIVKKVIDYYKGELWLDSKLGAGSTFFFKLPRRL